MYSEKGISPVIGIILLTAVTVALVSLAAFFVFDVGSSSTSGVGTATVNAEYESESRIDVQLLKKGSSDRVIVRTSLGTEYVLNETGRSVVLLNQDGGKTPVVLGEKDGKRSVLRSVPPRSFTPDIVVSKRTGIGQYENIQTALNNAQDGDIIVLQKGVYFENIDINTANITLVGESGTVIADNTSDNSVIDVKSAGVRISNIDVNASSSQGGTKADYGISTSDLVELARVKTVNVGKAETNGDVESVSESGFVETQTRESASATSLRIIPSNPIADWTQTYSSGEGYDNAFAVTVDNGNNIIVAGRKSTADDRFDWRVVKYNSSGGEQWVQTYSSGNGRDRATSVAVNDKNEVFVAGYEDSSNDGYNWRVVKYSSNGTEVWTNTYSSGAGPDGALALATDNQENIIVVGYENTSTSGKDWRIVKYNQSSSSQIWSSTYSGGSKGDTLHDVAIDSKDNIIVSGEIGSDSDKADWAVAKYYSNGTQKWLRTYSSGEGADVAYGVAIDNNDEIVVAGAEQSSADGLDWRVVKYTAGGNQRWVETYSSGNGYERAYSVVVDSKDKIAVGGYGRINGGIWRVVKYNSSGGQQWVETYNSGNGSDIVYSVGVRNESIIAAGIKYNGNTFDWRITQYADSE